jgi:NAD(P)-dependent dehydrogenase (short-subunit alcohol dehydrogenase family)
MDLGLQGKTSVVTGASKGIGLAIARALIEEGASVVAAARATSPELKALAETGRLRILEVDLASPDGPSRLIDFAGPLVDVLVNNVGSAPARTGGFLAVTDDDWGTTIGLNLLPAVRTTRAALPIMLEAGHGSIVNICSVNAKLADPAVIDYSAAKAALASFSKALSKELGPRGIRVNTISPGPVATDLWLGAGGVADTVARATGSSPDAVANQAAHSSVTGRFTRPSEVADLVLLLASDRTANVTGADITIDGGLVPTW